MIRAEHAEHFQWIIISLILSEMLSQISIISLEFAVDLDATIP